MSSGAPARFVAASFGTLAVVDLPAADDAAACAVLAAGLLPEERAHADGLPEARRLTFAGGRLALRAALALGAAAEPILSTPRGGPMLPAGFAGSIAHKPTLAVALAARAPADVTLGVDVEIDRASRFDLSTRVLTPAELRRHDALPSEDRARAVLVAFATKEAIYKALDPWLGRHVAFGEVEIEGRAAKLAPRAGEPAFTIELDEVPLAGHILVTARVQRRG